MLRDRTYWAFDRSSTCDDDTSVHAPRPDRFLQTCQVCSGNLSDLNHFEIDLLRREPSTVASTRVLCPYAVMPLKPPMPFAERGVADGATSSCGQVMPQAIVQR